MIDLSLGHVRWPSFASPGSSSLGDEYGPPLGIEALRDAAAGWVGVAPEMVAITTGASLALAATLATLGRSCSMLCPCPYYPLYPRLADLFGIELIYYELRPEQNWQPDGDELKHLIRDNTRAILWNCPGNPIGLLPSPGMISELCRVISSRDLLLISDETYTDYVFDNATVPNLAEFLTPDSLVRIRSFSKLLAMPGERVGFVVAASDRLAAISRAHWTLALSPPTTPQAIALSRMRSGLADCARRHCAILQRNRDAMDAIFRHGGIGVVKPNAGIFLWIGPFAEDVSAETLRQDCRSRAGVAVMPGSAFGIAAPAYLRVSFAVPEDEAVQGAEMLAKFLRPVTRACRDVSGVRGALPF